MGVLLRPAVRPAGMPPVLSAATSSALRPLARKRHGDGPIEAAACRTAAADAVAADALARKDARVLAVFGTGNQAGYECLALVRVRTIESVLVAGRGGNGADFVARLARHGLRAELTDGRSACQAADTIVTATPSRAPLLEADWVRPGTHVAAMGADSRGKQELPPALLRRASLLCDLPEQSTAIGEFQHATAQIATGEMGLTAIGEVLAGRSPGRSGTEEITVFDSSGIALQDLCVARKLLELLRSGQA